MRRAGILIGVRKASGLPVPQAALDGRNGMSHWARTQSSADNDIPVLTDCAGPVHVKAIKDEIGLLVKQHPVDRLLVYQAAHRAALNF